METTVQVMVADVSQRALLIATSPFHAHITSKSNPSRQNSLTSVTVFEKEGEKLIKRCRNRYLGRNAANRCTGRGYPNTTLLKDFHF